MDFNYVLRSIFALIIIIWLANVLLRQLNKYTQGQSKSIQIIERFSISKNSSLAIVKIVERYYLMSFNDSSNEILKEFAANEVDEMLEVMQDQTASSPSQLFTAINVTKIKDKYTQFFKRNQD